MHTCVECGGPVVVNDDGTANHIKAGTAGFAEVDFDLDGDHVPYVEEEPDEAGQDLGDDRP